MSNASDPLAGYRSGSTEPWTAGIIVGLIRALEVGQAEPLKVLETGTFLGTTTRMMFHLTQNTEITTVDLEQRHDGLPGSICFVEAEALAWMKSEPHESYDVIFLDDDHDREHVNAEIEEAKKLLRPKGLLLIHDVVGPFQMKGICAKHGIFVLDLPKLHAAGGLGIWQKP